MACQYSSKKERGREGGRDTHRKTWRICMTMLSPADIEHILKKKLPAIDQNAETVEVLSAKHIRLRMPYHQSYMGGDQWQDSGDGVYSGPKVMGLCDTAMYACMHAALGADVIAVISNINITFLRPAKAADLIAEASLIRQGKRLAYLEVSIFSDGDTAPVAHATSSFAFRIPMSASQ
jgi:uncharacterized protein (TIGR00369 family)